MNNTVNIIGRIDPAKKDTIGAKEFTEQIKEQMDKYAGINVDDKEDGQHAICDLQYVLGYNGTMKTDCKGMTTTTNPIKKNMKLVKDLTPEHIGDELPKMLKDLDKNMKLRGQYFIVAHLPYDESKNIKAGGRMMWIKFLDTEDKPELFTIYNNVQSQNHKITLGQSEKYSLKEDGKYISDKKATVEREREATVEREAAEREAAEKIQSTIRGFMGKKRANTVKEQKAAQKAVADEERKAAENARQMEAENARQMEAENARQMEAENARQMEAEKAAAVAAEKKRKAAENARQMEAEKAAESNRKAVAAAVRQQAAPAQQQQAAPAQQQAAQQPVVNVKKSTTKINTTNALLKLRNKLPQRTTMQRIRKADRVKHNQAKEDLIQAVNTEIIKYKNEFPESPIKQIDYEDKNIDNINQATIIAQIDDKIKEINDQLGGKSTRRRRRKMNPTRKRSHKKPKTKKKSNKGVIKRRKTRSKK